MSTQVHNDIFNDIVMFLKAYKAETPIYDLDIDPLNLKTSISTASYGDIRKYKSDVLFYPDKPESTSQCTIKEENRRYLLFLRGKEQYFITLVKRADFEDGMTNDATNFINERRKPIGL